MVNQFRQNLVDQINEAKTKVQQGRSAETTLPKLEAKLQAFDEAFSDDTKHARRASVAKASPRVVPTKVSKPITKAAPAKKAAKKAVVTKAQPKAKPSKARSSVNARVAAGRRAQASGARPKFKDALAIVMGADVCNATDILERLKAQNWVPDSNEPRAYIQYALSATKDAFEKVPAKGRGFYRVTETYRDHLKTLGKNGTPKATVASKSDDTEQTLADAGVIPQPQATAN